MRWHCVKLFLILSGTMELPNFHNGRYNILSDILTEFEVNLGIIIEKYDKI